MNRFVYLDNNATTKIATNVKEKILPYLDLQFGNPSSIYQHGKKVKKAVEEARQNCAKLINCSASNIIFTSGGSESNCSAINSAINQFPNKKKIITTKVEHSSILEYCSMLEKKGYNVVYLNVDKNCNIDLNQLAKEVDNNTCLVSIQLANNEVGTIILNKQALTTIRELNEKFNFLFHIDAVQGLGKLPIDVNQLTADFISFSGHKVHAPKGIGFLYIKNINAYTPLITGHQECGLRGGTENVLGIIALGEACNHIYQNLPQIIESLKKSNSYLEQEVSNLNGVTINCKTADRIPNTTSITTNSCNGNQLLLKLENHGICVSTGSACNSKNSEPSHVLTSMGVKYPQNSIRISIDEKTTNSQIDYFIKTLKEFI